MVLRSLSPASTRKKTMPDSSKFLAHIARVLDIPVEVFSPRRDGSDDRRATREEFSDLIAAFMKIEDQQARQRYLIHVQLTADQTQFR